MVHQYQLNGYNIVLDTCSGAIHVVDEVAYDIIALYPDRTADEIVSVMMEKYGAREDVTEQDLRDCIADVEALKKAGKLYTPDTFADMAGTFKERSGDVVKALCLHVAHTCNLNCSYCFASQGKYHGERALMSFEVGKQALDFLMDHSGSRTNLEVDFFGGEPLMNWNVVKQLVEYARSVEKERGKNFRFTLTTNGMLIDDDVIDFANREMSNVVLSLDGRKEIHDRLRVDYAGNGSYERIVPRFQQELLYARHLYPCQSGLYEGPVPHGGSGLHRAEHGAGGVRAGRPRCADGGGSEDCEGSVRAAGQGHAAPGKGR